MAILKANTIDVLGVNFYHPSRVKAPDISPNSTANWMPDRYYDSYDMPGRRMNVDKGWEIYPEALYDIAINIRDNYKNIDWFVSENGMGVSQEERFLNEEGVIDDDYRIDFITEHLEWLHKGIEEGSNCSVITYGHQLIAGHGKMRIAIVTDLYPIIFTLRLKRLKSQGIGLRK